MAKNKEEKVVIRKCHNCGRPIDEDKNFCLHCGETYTEIDPSVKKEANKARAKKALIISGIVLAACLVIAAVVLLIVRSVQKSDYLRVTEYLKEEGKFDKFYKVYTVEINDETYLSCSEEDETKFYLVRDYEVEGFKTKIKIAIDEDSKDEYKWEAFLSYEGGNYAQNFTGNYTGTLDPNVFTSKEGFVKIDKTTPEQDEEESVEESEEEESEASALAQTSSSSSEQDDSSEEQINPEEDIRESARQNVSFEVRTMILDLHRFFEKESGILVTIKDFGFLKYYEYMESLNPLK